MDGTEKVVKHLEMTQAVINRLGNNSFLLKGWSMTIIVTAMVLMARYDLQHPCLILSLIIPILGFWILDGYFLWQERLFRKIYDEVRCQSDTDFKMDMMKHKNKPKCSWGSAMFSVTLLIFYSLEVVLTVVVFLTTPGAAS
ncbi:MAG: hypothetical protein OXI53_06395 [Nitrospira sp.]|nr:hypothetical protein [Nitrospira sp.]MDE0404923.1 hypothetical protein [Nitrospira sp.]MDE0506809.1 hypothetical protein [Candidatus Poribacteria bacterium]